jgi:dethiobiotin synthetase
MANKIKHNKIFITATNTDVGKTYVTERLMYFYNLFGFKVGVVKPIETGVQNEPLDGGRLLAQAKKYNKNLENLTTTDIVPYQFKLPAAPYVAKANNKIRFDRIAERIQYMETVSDIVLIEGAGGLMVPIEEDYYMIDLIRELNFKTLLVTSSKLGTINDTLLSIEKLQQNRINFTWTVNLFQDKDEFFEVTDPFFRKKFKDYFIFQNDTVRVANSLIYD